MRIVLSSAVQSRCSGNASNTQCRHCLNTVALGRFEVIRAMRHRSILKFLRAVAVSTSILLVCLVIGVTGEVLGGREVVIMDLFSRLAHSWRFFLSCWVGLILAVYWGELADKK